MYTRVVKLFGRVVIFIFFLAILFLGSKLLVVSVQKSNPQITPTPSTAQPAVQGAEDSACHIRGVLPDPACTPGVVDSAVTQENIHDTICVRGYTKAVRPPVAFTNALKKQQIEEYGFTDKNLRNYEEDHLVPLELGGAPDDPQNLWPEPDDSPNPKDKIENLCNEKVCNGEMKLEDAQMQIATNWTTACQ